MVFDEETKKQPGVAIAIKQYQTLGFPIVEAPSLEELATEINGPGKQAAEYARTRKK